MRVLFLITLLFTNFAMASSFTFEDCDHAGIGLTSLVTPVAANSKTFGNGTGAITVYHVDHLEPAAHSAGVALVFHDVKSEIGDSKCVVVKNLSGVYLNKMTSSYDPKKGRLIVIPTGVYNPEVGVVPGGPLLKIRVNLSTSEVTIE